MIDTKEEFKIHPKVNKPKTNKNSYFFSRSMKSKKYMNEHTISM